MVVCARNGVEFKIRQQPPLMTMSKLSFSSPALFFIAHPHAANGGNAEEALDIGFVCFVAGGPAMLDGGTSGSNGGLVRLGPHVRCDSGVVESVAIAGAQRHGAQRKYGRQK